MTTSAARSENRLPPELHHLFWDCDPVSLDLQQHRNFIVRRILDRGNWDTVVWLRRNLGDAEIRDWFLRKDGGGLEPRKLRFWGLLLDLPRDKVDKWVYKARSLPWLP